MGSTVLNTVGLVLDIVGVILLFWFLPAGLADKDGEGNLDFSGKQFGGKGRSERMRCVALILIVVGFVLQIVAAWV